MDSTKDKRLFVDLDICAAGKCQDCDIQCSYFYHSQEPINNGIISVVELATYALVCRRCDEPHCVNSCPYEALEQQKENDKLLTRHNMRCVSCKSCSYACPYGAIYPEHVPYLNHNCDFCLNRRNEATEPLCIKSCSHGALKLVGPDVELNENTFLVGDNLVVHSTHWVRQKA
ncbi:MAG: 4Fe-4S dicluster domain-containing protein [Candidatus Omnitrophica bacterium]|nr:4Fe-4S dicluster domain-containing protein [Candidatus Omnitrophota bacterium]MBU2044541.1 4Fe-4S dicluster domain-containing protein [Candidatus Omnitrophota bacterium]MBU2473603.1 4Fe-4S dicluster domain-containing protein [Candidatus Omnitrophota bacterium]